MKQYLLLSLLLTGGMALSAQVTAEKDTLWNQHDELGRKQGFWKKYYPDSSLQYKGFFRDGRPLGQFIRYYDNGNVQAVMHHHAGGRAVEAQLYYMNGRLAGEGKYDRQEKDSTWNYYSYYTGDLMYAENYTRGIKQGKSLVFYASGKVAEEQYWENDKRSATWYQYYENERLRMQRSFREDQLHGSYEVYSPDGIKVVAGRYDSGNMDGTWSFYSDQGKLEYQLKYRDGENLNEELYRKKALEFWEGIEENMGKIPEPNLNNFAPGGRR